MNYEQKYNEALQKAKEEYNRLGELGNESMKRSFEIIFPELAESEDERIRQELVYFIQKEKEYMESQVKPENSPRLRFFIDALAWLEKQKEQKVDIDKLRKDIYQSGYNDGYQHGKEDAQKEQRLVEWSEEDESMLNRIIETLSLPPIYDTKACAKMVSWLKSLRPQPKEQDVEKYSEDKSFEDEWKEYYNNGLVSRLPMNKREVAKHFYWFAKRNTWKPSEEQMEALEETINQDCVVCNGDRKWIKPNLESLYEQLKKMKAPKGVPPIESIQK